MGRSLSSRQWPTFTKLVRNSIFKCPWIDWYSSLFTYSRGQIYTDLLSLTSTTNKAIDQGTKLFLGCDLWHLGIKYCLKINKNPPFPLQYRLFLERQQLLPFEKKQRSCPPPPQQKHQLFLVMPAAETGLALIYPCWIGILCSGEIKGKAVSKWTIHKSLALGFQEGQPLMYLQIRTISLSIISGWICSSP